MDAARPVIGFGDSILLGAGATTPERGCLGVLAQLLDAFAVDPVQVTNRGVGDNVISSRSTGYSLSNRPSALERVRGDVAVADPAVVLISFGLNDMRFGTPIDVFLLDLQEVVAEVQRGAPTARIVLTNVFHMTGFDRYPPRDRGSRAVACAYNAGIERLASSAGFVVADVGGAMGEMDELIDADGVHPTDLGHAVVGHCLFQALVRASPELFA